MLHPRVVIEDGCQDRRPLHHPLRALWLAPTAMDLPPSTGCITRCRRSVSWSSKTMSRSGANVCIDRAALGETRIGRGTKVDNLVQIAHNVQIGEHCLLVAQIGISGSCKIGHHMVFAGQSGCSGHLKIGNGVVLAARAVAIKDVPDGVTSVRPPRSPPPRVVEDTGEYSAIGRPERKDQRDRTATG